MTDALDAVIDAALERALLADDARRYFALAGALERGRSASRLDGTGSPGRAYRESDAGGSESSMSPTSVFGAALVTTVAVDALASTADDDIDPGAWSPGRRGGDLNTELVAAGAAAACRRFDVEPEAVAARSGLTPERLARRRADGEL